MHLLSALLFLYLTSTLLSASQDYFISPIGDDNHQGRKDSPFKTLKKALSLTEAGGRIYLRKGVYPLGIYINVKGSKNAPIMISAFKDEKVLFKGNKSSKNNDLRIRGNWIILQNIEIKHSYNGLLIEKGASHNIIKNISSHDNHFSGFMLTRGASYNTLINCDAYKNIDFGGSLGDGGHADGFGTGSRIGNEQYIGEGNRFINCRAWKNSDDGFDFWKSGNPVTVIGCSSYENGYAKGDGNGFKLGPHNPIHPNDTHLVINSKAWGNRQNGFGYNDNKSALLLHNNIAYNNFINYKFLGKASHIMIDNESIHSQQPNKLSSHIINIDNNWKSDNNFSPTEKQTISSIIIMGDSTVSDYAADSDMGGWGEFLKYLLPKTKVRNFAKSGKSSKTFYLDGLWDKTYQSLEKGSILLMQFGHNDSHINSREGTSMEEYRAFLTHYITQAKAKGVYPILVTPMHRLKFDANGHLRQDLKKYETTMLALAKKHHIPCINLYAISESLFEKLGEEKSKLFSPNNKDKTHFSKIGAAVLASYVVESLLDE